MAKFDETKPYIFISYAHKDSIRVKDIMGRLRNEGYNIWYDGGIDPGTEWDENIAAHIKNCAYFIAFISGNYIASKNCKDELNYARDLDKSQLLVYLEDVSLPDGMAMRMNRLQAIWWEKYRNPEEAFKKLFTAKGINIANTNTVIKTMGEIGDVSGGPIEGTEPGYVVYREPDKKVPAWVFILGGLVVLLIVLVLVLLISGGNTRSGGNDTGTSQEKTDEASRSEKSESGSNGEAVKDIPDPDLNRAFLETEYGEIMVEYPDVICDFYTGEETVCAQVKSVKTDKEDIAVNFTMRNNERNLDTITLAVCLYTTEGISSRELHAFNLAEDATGEVTYRLRVHIPDDKLGNICQIHIYAMKENDVLYSEIIDNEARPGKTIQILQDYSSGSCYDSGIRMVLGNFRTEPVEGNADYIYLYAHGNVCRNDGGSAAWFTDLECFDENGNVLDYNTGRTYLLGFSSPGYDMNGDNTLIPPMTAGDYVNPSEMVTTGEGARVMIPANTKVINIRAYDARENDSYIP